MPIEQAIARAKEQELDLVEVSPKATPPVCKILDYGKYLYAEGKKEQKAKSKQKKVETKGIRLRLRTDTHDLDFKRAQAEKFLTHGHKVKIELVLRGREKALPDKARDALREFLNSIKAPFGIEEDIKRFPNGLHIIIAPK
jgi:translation initiation factor IF-3